MAERRALLDRVRTGPTLVVADEVPDAADPRLRQWPSFAPEGYLGQLQPEFQQMLADEYASVTREECSFYHSVELPDGEVIAAPWDLRGREAEYLGQLELASKRVLEFGPASGHLTRHMEHAGADVVGFEVGYDASIDLFPTSIRDTRKIRLDHARNVARMQNSWWYLHRAFASRARMVYGDIYRLPGDLGEFDVSVFGAILLHLRSPITALEQAARRTRSQIVVTEPWEHGADTLHDDIMKIFPLGEAGRWVIWWSISAGAVVRMLEMLGFTRTRVTEHVQRHQYGHIVGDPYRDVPMYTVVGERA